MLPGPVGRLPTGPAFAVELPGLAADRIRHLEVREEVALVARVDVYGSVRHGTFTKANVHTLEEAGQQSFGYVRLRPPDAPERHVVVLGDGGIEAPREAAEHPNVTEVGPAQATGDHSADVGARLDEDRPCPRLAGGNRGCDAGAGSAEHGDIGQTKGSSLTARSTARRRRT